MRLICVGLSVVWGTMGEAGDAGEANGGPLEILYVRLLAPGVPRTTRPNELWA